MIGLKCAVARLTGIPGLMLRDHVHKFGLVGLEPVRLCYLVTLKVGPNPFRGVLIVRSVLMDGHFQIFGPGLMNLAVQTFYYGNRRVK
jgi:hypothetical protein